MPPQKTMTQKQQIQELLEDGAWHHMSELNSICYRYSARLYDLEREGYKWEKRQLRRGEFIYRKKKERKPMTNESFNAWVESIQRKAKTQIEEKQDIRQLRFL